MTYERERFRIATREAFEAAAPAELVTRAAEVSGSLVLWDTHEDGTGLVLIGDHRPTLETEQRRAMQDPTLSYATPRHR